ncbi:hypothetical protein PWT90_10504 [Aphanocladium album]|nr:hypothetical protein PWT90_10504 [Aphanocladium album]
MTSLESKVKNRASAKRRPQPLRLDESRKAQILCAARGSPRLTQTAIAEQFQVPKSLVAKLIKQEKELRIAAAAPVSPALTSSPGNVSPAELHRLTFGHVQSPIPAFGQLQSPIRGFEQPISGFENSQTFGPQQLGQPPQTPGLDYGQLPQTPRSEFGPLQTPRLNFEPLGSAPELTAQGCICRWISPSLWDEISACGNAYTKACIADGESLQLDEAMDFQAWSPAPAFFPPLENIAKKREASDETEDEREDAYVTQLE